MKSLSGRRICITRARQQAGSLAEALAERGAEVMVAPMIEIVPPDSYAALDAALQNLTTYDWLIVTSANGAAALHGRMQALGIANSTEKIPRVIAIGPATARTLEKYGWIDVVLPQEYVAEAVVEAMREGIAGQRIVLVRAKIARDVIPDALTRLGARVDVVEAYQTVIPDNATARLQAIFSAEEKLPEMVTFTSSSTAKNFFLLMRAAKLEWPKNIVVASIGPITSQTLREHGVEPNIEAKTHTIVGLVEAIQQSFARSLNAE